MTLKKSLTALVFIVLALVLLSPAALAQTEDSAVDDSAMTTRMALAIKASANSTMGEKVQIHVYDRKTGHPVGGAMVWAASFRNSTVAKDVITANSAVIGSPDFLVGWTDRSGNVDYAFTLPAYYLLTSFKDGYMPGFSRINVIQGKALAIKAPGVALVGEEVRIYVFERNTSVRVPKAEVWAVSSANTPMLTNHEEENAVLVKKHGELLGYTGEDGFLNHKFSRTDKYLLVAIKDNYIPGFATIKIGSEKALLIKAPSAARPKEPVSIRVLERSVLTVETPVQGAEVWAVNMTNTTARVIQPSEEMARKHGILLGSTDKDGYVDPQPVLSDPGQYWLIAIKENYTPGFSRIIVKPLSVETPNVKPLPRVTIVPPIKTAPSLSNTNTKGPVTDNRKITAGSVKILGPYPVDNCK